MPSGFESSFLYSDFMTAYKAARVRLANDYSIKLPESIDWEVVEEMTYINRWVSYIRELEATLDGRELIVSHYVLQDIIGYIKAWRDTWILGSRHRAAEDKAAIIVDECGDDFRYRLNQLKLYTATAATYILMLAPFAPTMFIDSFRPLNRRGDLDARPGNNTLYGYSEQELLGRVMGLGYRSMEPYESYYYSQLDRSFSDATVCFLNGVPYVALPMEYTVPLRDCLPIK